MRFLHLLMSTMLSCLLNEGVLPGTVPALATDDFTSVACVLPFCDEQTCPGDAEYHLRLHYGINVFVSFDVFTYTSIPVITSISGCQDEGNGTVCPAVGGNVVLIHLQKEVGFAISALIGGVACINSTKLPLALSCIVPAGTGSIVATVVAVGGYLSEPVFFISYAPPRIDDIIGGPNCSRTFASNGSIVLDGCDRAGSTNTSLLTMLGANFGTSKIPSILLNFVSVKYERNNDSVIYLYLLPGFGSGRELTVNVNGQSASAMVNYALCPPGMDSNCVACDAGRYGVRQDGFDTCQSCPAGKYQPATGQTTCSFCAKGFLQPSAGSAECLSCPMSTTSAGVGSTELDACSTCPLDFYLAQSDLGLVCEACPPNSVPDRGSKACICNQGFYDVSNYGNVSSSFDPKLLRCAACPTGADCSSSGNLEVSLYPVTGWWRSSEGSFYACLKGSNCPAGSNSTSVCAEHRSGVLCAICEQGYQDPAGGGACTSCNNSGAYVWVSITLVLLAVIVTGVVFWYQRWKYEAKSQQRTQGIKISFPEPGEPAAPSVMKLPSIPVMPSAKLVVGFMQVLTSVVSSFLALPSIFVDVMSVFAFINFDFVPWASVRCAFGIDFFAKIYIACIYPLVVMCLLLLFVVVPIAFLNKRDYEDADTARVRRRQYLNQAWTLLLFCLFLLYPWITLQLLQFGICIHVGSDYYLMADFTQKCFQNEWLEQLPIVLCLFFLIPVGVPLAFGMILWRARPTLRTAATRAKIGFLYASYFPNAWWFELFDMAYKVALISVVRFFDTEVQAPIRMGVCFVYIAVVLTTDPFLYKTWDFLSLLCAVEVLLLSLLAHVLPAVGAWQGTYIDVLLSLLLLFLVFMVFIYFCSLVVRTSRYLMRHPRVRKYLWPEQAVTRLRMATQFRDDHTISDAELLFDTAHLAGVNTDSTVKISTARSRQASASVRSNNSQTSDMREESATASSLLDESAGKGSSVAASIVDSR